MRIKQLLLFAVLMIAVAMPSVQAVDTSYIYSFDTQTVPNATISLLKNNGNLYNSWTTDELGSYDLDQIKTYLQSKWSSLPNGYVFYIQVEKYPFDCVWKMQKIDATHIKVNDGNTYTTSTIWSYLKNNLCVVVSSGYGYASREDITISSTATGHRVDASGDSARIFIEGDLHYRYLVQHVNDSGNIIDEFTVYPQQIDDDWYIVFDADQWSYYTVDGSLIDVGITDMRLVNNTVQITGDGYDLLSLQADYANSKLKRWNQKVEYSSGIIRGHNPWRYAHNTEDNRLIAYTSILSGISTTLHNLQYGTRTAYDTNVLLQHTWSHDTTNNYYQYVFYVDSDHNIAQDVVIETYTPDHIDYFIVEFYNLTAGAYQEVLNDTTYTAANLIHLNNTSVGLDFALYRSGQRGDTVSAIYGNTSKPDQTVSAYYGCINRTLMLFTLPADGGTDSASSDASQVKIRLTCYYDDPGYATYEFEDSTNVYYGLDNLEQDETGNTSTLILYKAGTQNVTYITNESGNTIIGMTVRADENELIDELFITFASTPTNLTGLIINNSAIDVDTDSDSDNVPDAFEDANISLNKGQQGGELKWDYVWEGVFNIVNSTGYIYYTNLINGSGLVGTEIQVASTTGTANITVDTIQSPELYRFTVNSGAVDWLNITSELTNQSQWQIEYTSNNTIIETETVSGNSANFTTNLSAGTYRIIPYSTPIVPPDATVIVVVAGAFAGLVFAAKRWIGRRRRR